MTEALDPITVEVPGSLRRPEPIAELDHAPHLGEELPTGAAQPSTRSVQHVDRPGDLVLGTSDRLARNPDR